MPSDPPFKVGDRVRTDFYKRESRRIRIVRAVEPNTFSQTRWSVVADGIKGMAGCGVDSAWFTLAKKEDADARL